MECVNCRGTLTLKDHRYICVECGSSFQVVKDIPLLVSSDALKRTAIEDKRWLQHPIEGVDKPIEWSINHKRGYFHFFRSVILDKFDFGGRVLEIGAGSCWASSLVKLFNPKCKVYSTDISVQALLKGVKLSRSLGVCLDYMVACDAHRIPFRGELFDKVLGVAILHHLPRPKDAAREIWRVLKPGGFYIGIREGLASPLFKPLYRWFGGGVKEEKLFGAIENVYTYEEWTNILSDFEFELILKRDACLGLTIFEEGYYALANFLPQSVLRHVAATLEIVARKPVEYKYVSR